LVTSPEYTIKDLRFSQRFCWRFRN